jgi:hypothetical protein
LLDAGWIVKDPLKDIDLLGTSSAKVYLEDEDFAAVGEALRGLKEIAAGSTMHSRHVPSMTSLLAFRAAIYTGCRHVEEFLKVKVSWLRQDRGVARLEVP